MSRTVKLLYPATCRDCGTALKPGDSARYYGRGRVYGIGCHADTRPAGQRGRRRAGSADFDGDGGAYGGRGELVSSRCEDYPCCGHGPSETGGDGGGCPRVYEDAEGRRRNVWPCAGCGADLAQGATSSLCGGCLRRATRGDDFDGPEDGGGFNYSGWINT